MRHLSKWCVALVSAFVCSLGWAEVKEDGTVAIQFRHAEADTIANGSDYDSGNGPLGYVSDDGTRGGQIAAGKWNIMAVGSSGTDVTVTGADGTEYTLTYSANNTYSKSGVTVSNTDNMIKHLTHGYLDVPNHNGGSALSITLSGVPTTGYDVALILSGDTGENKLGIATVNGAQYGSNGWGNSAPAETLAEGVNVLYIASQQADPLTISVAKNTSNRATIAGLMVFPKTISTCTATANADTAFSALTWDNGIVPVEGGFATVTLGDGKKLTIDAALNIAKLILVCEGSCTLAVADASYLGSAQLDVSGVTGTATLEYTVGSESSVTTIPFSGFDVVKKLGSGTYSTTTDTFAGAQLIVSEGFATLDANLSSTIATAEKPMTVTGAGTELKLKGTNHQKNRLPNGGTVLATDGATLAIEGVNLFADGANRPYIKADNATVRVDTYSGSHMKVNTVTLSNNATLQLAGTAAAYGSEALVLDNDGSQITVTSGTENKLEYASGATENTIKIASGIIEVAADAKLTSNIVLKNDIVKKGDGELEMPQTRLKNVEIQAGTLSVTGATGTLAQTISGEGTLKLTIADELKVSASQLEGFTGSIEVTSGTVVLPLAQAQTATMASGTTLKVALTAEEQFSDQDITKEGVTVYFYNEDGSTPLVTDGEGNALPGAYTAPTKTWTISSADPVNWSDAVWTGGTPTETDAACIDVGGNDVTVTMDAAATLKSLMVKGSTGGKLTLAGLNALTVTVLLDVKVNVDVASTVLVLPETVIETGATLAYEVPADTTVALPNMSGTGTFAKKGAGTVRFDTNQHENDVVADGITIELYEGAYYVGLNDSQQGGDPYLRDATVKFMNAGVEFGSFGWLHLEGTVTVDVPATITDAALSSLPDKMLPSVKGENATLVKTGDGDFKAAFDNIQTIQINGGAIVVDGTKTMQGVIAGTGKVKTVAEAVVTLSGTNTYSGGTDIVDGATLKITNPNALGTTGTITGAGVLEISGTYNGSDNVDPIVNKNGLTSETWTGTVRYTTAGHQAHFYLDSVGNANSEIEFAGATGFFYKEGTWSETATATVRLTGEGLQMQNGSSGSSSNMKLFIPKLVGDGKLKGPGGNNNWNYTVIIDDASEFAGDIYLPTGHATQFGVIIGTDTLPSGYSASNYWKHITIVEGGVANVAEGKTWTPAANSQVKVYGTIGGKGTVATALAFQDGAMLDVTEDALAASGTVSYGGALTVKVAEDATFPVAILAKAGVAAPTSYTIQQGETTLSDCVIATTEAGISVVEAAVKIGEARYATLAAALAAEGDGAEITLIKDNAETLTIGQACTINLNGKTLSGSVTFTADTSIAGDGTLSGYLSAAAGINVTIASGQLTLAGANGGFLGTFTVANGATLETTAKMDDQWAITVPFGKGTIVNDGTVLITDGPDNNTALLPPMSGTGDLVLNRSARLATALTITGTVTIAEDQTLTVVKDATDFSAHTPSINGPSVVLNGNLVIAETTEGTPDGTVTIAATKTLSGAGAITGDITFADGATLAGTPTVTGTATFDGALTVKVDAVTTDAILTAGSIIGTLTATAIEVAGVDQTDAYMLSVVENALYIVAVPVPTGVAKIGDTVYETLKAAVDAVNAGSDTVAPEIVLTANAEGEGIIIKKPMTIDFAHYTYTVNLRTFAGSANTQTQCFQILKEAGDVTLKHGQIIADDSAYTDVTGTGYGAQSDSGKLLKILVQNYANLTLEDMTLDATTVGATHVGYALSNNHGTVVISGSTITARTSAAEDDTAYAFDVCYNAGTYASGLSVTLDAGSTITGDIEISGEPMVAGKTFALTLNVAPIGALVMGEGAEQATITKVPGLVIAAPEGYEWAEDTRLVKSVVIAPPVEGEIPEDAPTGADMVIKVPTTSDDGSTTDKNEGVTLAGTAAETVIKEEAKEAQVTTVTEIRTAPVTIPADGDTPAATGTEVPSAQDALAAVELFTDVVTVEPTAEGSDEGVAVISYAFGISEMSTDGINLTVKAKVLNGNGGAAGIKTGTFITLMTKDGTVLRTQTALPDTPDEVTFTIPLTELPETTEFTVKASK